MNQMIEEPEFEENAARDFGVEGRVQFVARIGYVDQYPEPVSVRRPVESFITDKRKVPSFGFQDGHVKMILRMIDLQSFNMPVYDFLYIAPNL